MAIRLAVKATVVLAASTAERLLLARRDPAVPASSSNRQTFS